GTTTNIIRATSETGHGEVWAVDNNTKLAEFVNRHLVETLSMLPGGTHYDPHLVVMDSLDFEVPDDVRFGICWFDTPLHREEFEHFRPAMRDDCFLVFTSPDDDLADDLPVTALPMPGPHGLLLARLR